jgi:hypothetical protein
MNVNVSWFRLKINPVPIIHKAGKENTKLNKNYERRIYQLYL